MATLAPPPAAISPALPPASPAPYCTTTLAPLFPGPVETVVRLTPSNAIFQAAPTALAFLAWIAVDASRRRRAFSRADVSRSFAVGLLAAVAQAVLVWHAFDLLACDDAASFEPWKIIGSVGSLASSALLLVAIAPRAPRATMLTFGALAAGTVLADWSLRERGYRGAMPLVAVQQTYCLLLVTVLSRLPARRMLAPTVTPRDPLAKRSTKKGAAAQIDPLARHGTDARA